MDPTEITDRFVSLAGEFGNLAEIVNLPNLTPRLPPPRADGHGRQPRRAVRRPGRQLQRGGGQQAVILESLAWGNEGGNDLFATFRNPVRRTRR